MRRTRLLLCLLGAVVSALAATGLALAAPARAGGPTSVMLVGPGTGSVAALYVTDPRYEELMRLVGGGDLPSGTPLPEDAGPYPDGASQVSVTWLVHDVQVWRVDRILLDRSATWIDTAQSPDGSIWDRPMVRHAAPEPAALRTFLDRLGLLDASVTVPSTTPAARAAASVAPTSAATDAGTPSTATAGSAAGSSTGTLIGIGAVCLLAGVALGAGIRRVPRRPRDGERREPPQSPNAREMAARPGA